MSGRGRNPGVKDRRDVYAILLEQICFSEAFEGAILDTPRAKYPN